MIYNPGSEFSFTFDEKVFNITLINLLLGSRSFKIILSTQLGNPRKWIPEYVLLT